MVHFPMAGLVVFPLLGALVSLALSQRWRTLMSFALILALLLNNALLLLQFYSQGMFNEAMGNWPAPLGIELRIDGLALIFSLMSAIVASICALYAYVYLRPAQLKLFWPFFWFLWVALNSIWLSSDLFNLYVGLELLSLAAVGLVALSRDALSLAAALRYLFAALLGSIGYLLGVALLYATYGTLSLVELSQHFSLTLSSSVALGFMFIGLLMKTAVFPMHSWLPPAHGGALTPVSALLSALVIKASFYIVLRLWTELSLDSAPTSAGLLMGILGSAAILWGGWMALHQTHLKLVVAYSTLAQIGYFMLIFPLLSDTNPHASHLAFQGGILMLLAHALAKAGMFLAAGNLLFCTGQKDLHSLAGLSRYRPLNIFAFGLAGVSIMGLPPSGGFNGKWLIIQSAMLQSQWQWVLVILLGSLLSAAYIFRVFSYTYQEVEGGDRFKQPSPLLEWSALSLSVLSILLGFASMLVLDLLPSHSVVTQ
ncbi:complex I subunit 5 family protein [Nitrincola alkalisediminis]|uniref:complex I subunit 5 family protein n=1 Tax=Nitrincola alkalisediminis TaxID=1366656 RepID=UPI001CA81266|nr:proton-conducting transporter membrane subunit [Nitrincola alkalisediminis]